MKIQDLRNVHSGQDVYVLGNGPSLELIDPLFFQGKVTIGINDAAFDLPWLSYVITRYHESAKLLFESRDRHGACIVVSRHQHGDPSSSTIDIDHERVVIFEHGRNCGSQTKNMEFPAEPSLISSFSTITSAMNFAAHVGARSCILVGHDCGLLDFNMYRRGYAHGPIAKSVTEMFPYFEEQSILVKRFLKDRYGMNTYSLNPFINQALEGHRYFSMGSQVNIGPLYAIWLRWKFRFVSVLLNPLKITPAVVRKAIPKPLRKRLAKIIIDANKQDLSSKSRAGSKGEKS